MAKKLNQNILIETIDLSAGTQQRPLSPETVQHYTDLRKDGVMLPPVKLIWTDEAYVLWDGFHRIAVAQNLGETHIRANVEAGNLRQAVWFSYHANAEHGLPRQSGASKAILQKIFADPEWSNKSVADIAQHVGCSRTYASRTKNEGGAPTVGAPEDPKRMPNEGKTIGPKHEGARAEMGPTHPLTDDEGQVVPSALADRFLSRSVIKDRINELDQVKNSVKNRISDGDLTYALLNQQGFKTDMQNLRNRLKAAIPYALCPYCKGGCGACHEMGFVNKETWKAAPKNELR